MGKGSGIILDLQGFDEFVRKIEKAGLSADNAMYECAKDSAEIIDRELRSQLNAVTKSNLADRMPKPDIAKDATSVTAHVGFHKGAYDPQEPSDGYKAVFLNYGTPKRRKHGEEAARGFIRKAKNKSKKIIKNEQQNALKKILSELK